MSQNLKPFAQWLTQQNRSPKTIRSYLDDAGEFLKQFGRGPTLVRREDLDKYVLELGQRPGRRSPLMTPASVIKKFNGVSAYLRFLVYTKVIPANPADGVLLPKKPHREVVPLSRDEIELMRQVPASTFKEKLDRLVLELFYASGCRLGDLATVKLKDYNPVTRSFQVVGKGQKQLTKRLTVGAQAMLTEYLASVQTFDRTDRPLLVYEDGETYPRGQIYLSIKRLGKKALPGKRVFCHLLRHTCLSHRNEAGEDLRSLQEFAGHSSPNTTARYVHISDEQAAKRVDEFDPDRKSQTEKEKA